MRAAFFVPGDPVPQARPRAYRMGDSIRMYDPKTSSDWKKTIAQVATLNRAKQDMGPLSMSLIFYMRPPKAMKSSVIEYHVSRPDLDNLIKAVKDALNGVCYKDDSQIWWLVAAKMYAGNPSLTGVQIIIEGINAEDMQMPKAV